MENRIGIVGIVIDDPTKAAEKVNEILSEFSDIIIGRMGLPYRKRSIHVISIMVDGTNERIGALSGKLGRLEGVNAKCVLSNKKYEGDLL